MSPNISTSRVSVRWLLKPDGPLISLPQGPIVSGVVNVREIDRTLDDDQWWSLLVEFDEHQIINNQCDAKIRFLFETAPSYLLKRQSEFGLYRGHMPIARILISD